MFYSILYGTSETPRRDRIWLLRFLTDAVHSSRVRTFDAARNPRTFLTPIHSRTGEYCVVGKSGSCLQAYTGAAWPILRSVAISLKYELCRQIFVQDTQTDVSPLQLLHQLAGIRHAATDLLFQSGVAAWIAQASLRAQLGGDEQEKALLLTALHRLMGSAMFGKVGKRRDNLQLSLAEVTDALISLQTNRGEFPRRWQSC